jgi:hypothetical protein
MDPLATAGDFLSALDEGHRPLFELMMRKALSLGYKMSRDKTRCPSYSFSSRKYGTTILRVIDDGKRRYIRLKFFGSASYPPAFEAALKRTIEEYDFKYTGCYGCGSCATPIGYRIEYPDGREYFRCGRELVEIFDIDEAAARDAERLMEEQTAYFEGR